MVGGAPAFCLVVVDEVLGSVEVRCTFVTEEGVLPGDPEDGLLEGAAMAREHLLVFELSQNTIDSRHVEVGVLNDVTHGSEEAVTIFGDVGGRFDDCERLEDEGHARRVLVAEVVVGDDAVDGGGLLVGEVHVGHGGQWGQVVRFHAETVPHWALDVQVALGVLRLFGP